MAPSFQDSGRYKSAHAVPNGPGDDRPTSLQIIQDNDLIDQMKGKVILLTGGSNGIGVDTLRAFAATGAKVFFTSRDLAKGEKVKDEVVQSVQKDQGVAATVEVIHLDLTSLDSVRQAAEEFKSRSDRLDILVNNAGIALTSFGHTKDGYEQQFGVNHLAHFHLFQLLKPMLLKSSTPSYNSRVVNVASSIHTMASVNEDYNFKTTEYNPFIGYASSKTCNIWMANEIERRYGAQGLHAISAHPGGINTGLAASHDPEAAKQIEAMIQSSEYIQKAFKSTEQGAATTVLAAVGKEYEGVGGFYMEDCGVSPPMAEDAELGTPGYKPWAYDDEGARKLWVDSLKMLGLEED